MFGILACPVRGWSPPPPPDPWEVFREETLEPLFELGLMAGAGLLGLAVAGALVLGLATRLPARDRGVCAALPMIIGVATFVHFQLEARPAGDWWATSNAVHEVLRPLSLGAVLLGPLVMGRPLFFAEEHER